MEDIEDGHTQMAWWSHKPHISPYEREAIIYK